MATTKPRHVSAVLKLPRRVKDIGAYTQSIITSMTGNSSFPNPSPALATVQADLDAFNASEATALTRAKGAAEARNAKLLALEDDLRHLLDYVQGVANADPASADAIIQSAGMAVRKVTLHAKGDIVVKQGPVSGSVKLVVKAVATRACYEWQYSTDQKTWTEVPPTLQSKTEIDGLTPATAYFFHFRGITKDGKDERRPDAPPRLSDLVHEMLAKDPRTRPQSMEEVSWRLQHVNGTHAILGGTPNEPVSGVLKLGGWPRGEC